MGVAADHQIKARIIELCPVGAVGHQHGEGLVLCPAGLHLRLPVRPGQAQRIVRARDANAAQGHRIALQHRRAQLPQRSLDLFVLAALALVVAGGGNRWQLANQPLHQRAHAVHFVGALAHVAHQ